MNVYQISVIVVTPLGILSKIVRKKEDLVVELPQEGPSGTVKIVSFRRRDNKNQKGVSENHHAQAQQQEAAKEQHKEKITISVHNDDETFHQALPGQDNNDVDAVLPQSSNLSATELGILASPIMEEKEAVLSVAPEVAPVTPPVTPAAAEISSPVATEKGLNVPAKTNAQVLSANRFAALSTDEKEVTGQAGKIDVIWHSASLPSPQEVMDKVLKSQMQIERDLQRIAEASSLGYCSAEELDGFVQVKSRSLKKMRKKNNSLKKKVVISAGLGKMGSETPAHSPQQPSRILSYGYSSSLKAARRLQSSKKLRHVHDDLQLELDAMVQDISMPHSDSCMELPSYSRGKVDSFDNPTQNLPTCEDCTQLYGHSSKVQNSFSNEKIFNDNEDGEDNKWKARSSFLDDNLLDEREYNTSWKNWPCQMESNYGDCSNFGNNEMSDFDFEGPYLLNERVTKNTTDRFNSLGSFSPFYKHQAPKSDHEFMTSHRSRYPTVGRNFDYRNLKKQSNWCNFATEDAMDGLSTLSEESCSSSAVRGKTTQNSPLNSMARQSMRRYDSDFCSPDYGLRNTYAKETRCRNRDEIQQGESANGSGKYTRKSNSSRSKPAIYLNSTFQKKLEPHDGWFFEDGYHPGFSSFCQTMETDCAPDGKLWYEDPFDAFSVPKSSFQRSKHDLPVEYSRSGGSFFTEKLSFCQPYNGIDPYGSPVFSKVGFGPSKPDLSPGPEIESMHPGLSHVVGSHVKLPDLSSQESFYKDGENESTFVLTACQTSELEKESIGNNVLSSEIEKPVENASDSKDNGSECEEVKDGTLELRESKLTDSPVHTDDTSSTVKIPSESESSTDEKEYQNDTQIQSQEGNKEIGDCGLEERKKASERQNASGNPSHHVMMFESYVLQYLCVQKVLKEASSHDTLKKV